MKYPISSKSFIQDFEKTTGCVPNDLMEEFLTKLTEFANDVYEQGLRDAVACQYVTENQYITPEESVRLFYCSDFRLSNGATMIADAAYQHQTECRNTIDHSLIIRTVFYAGRVAGIREERARRNRGINHEAN